MQRRHKLWLTAAVLLLLVACLLAGCAGDTGNSDDMVARSDYEAVCAERDQLGRGAGPKPQETWSMRS